MIKKISYSVLYFYFVVLLGTGCVFLGEEVVVTPPIATVAATAAGEVASATAVLNPTPLPTTPPPELATEVPPEEPTAVPTEPIPTELPSTDMPAPTAIPETAVSSVTLHPLIQGGLQKPVFLTHAGDERMFIVEQKGTIHIYEGGQLLAEPYLDIQDRVNDGSFEQGLLGLAFHPNYGENGRFFINYTNASGDTVISRFQVSTQPNVADASSELILMTIEQPFGNHNGGQVSFGPDGYLYIGMGDGGSANDPQEHGQNGNTLLGSILRIDVDHDSAPYAIPADNPFVNSDAPNEIWSIGWRNPWRFSFDRLTGDMYIADVGQNQYEEVHFQPTGSSGGENYGWNVMEGLHCFSPNFCDKMGLELPIFEYPHDFGCSITGGYVYRGQKYPEFYGNYFTGDYCTGNLWSVFQEADGSWTSQQVYSFSGLLISSFGEDVNGELYLLDHEGGLWEIRP